MPKSEKLSEKSTLNMLIKKTISDEEKTRFSPSLFKETRKLQEESYRKIDQFYNDNYSFKGLLSCLPTSYGKSNVGLYACEQARKHSETSFVIVPLKALATEHGEQKWGKYFQVLIITSDYKDNKKLLHDNQIESVIMTFEMLFQYIIKHDAIMMKTGLIVVDEAHLMGDESRGYRIELMLRFVQRNYPKIKLVLLSATVGNPKEFANYLKLDSVIGTPADRPVPLKMFSHVIPDCRKNAQRMEYYKEEVEKIMLTYLNQFGKDNMPNFLFFCTTKPHTRALSAWFNDRFGEYGFNSMVHNASLKRNVRNETEQAYRSGKCKYIFCTTTLSMGIDMPCDVVVLLGETFFMFLKKKEKKINGSQIIQIGGRAGRSKDQSSLIINGQVEGHAHYVYQEANADYVEYYMHNTIPVESRVIPITDEEDPLYSEDQSSYLDSALLCSIFFGIINKEELKQFYLSLFRKKSDLKVELFETTYEWLAKFHFLKDDGSITKMGQDCCIFAIRPETALHFVQLKYLLNNYKGEVDYPTLYALTLMTPEFTDNITVNPDDETDATALRIAKRYINGRVINEVIGDNEYLQKMFTTRFDLVCKAFSMTYATYLTDIKVLQKDEIPCNANDMFTIQSSAQRIMNAGFRVIGKRWKYGDALEFLNEGIQMETPTFDQGILELCGGIDGLGIKSAQTLIKMGIKSLTILGAIVPLKVSEKTRELKEKEEGIYMNEKKLTEWKKQAIFLTRGEHPEEVYTTSLIEE